MSIRVFTNFSSASKTGNILTLWLHKDVLVRSMQGSVFEQEHYHCAIATNSHMYLLKNFLLLCISVIKNRENDFNLIEAEIDFKNQCFVKVYSEDLIAAWRFFSF